MNYIIIYDIPRGSKALQVRVNRILHSIGARMIQHSVWESNHLERLKEIEEMIEKGGGEAFILEKKIIP